MSAQDTPTLRTYVQGLLTPILVATSAAQKAISDSVAATAAAQTALTNALIEMDGEKLDASHAGTGGEAHALANNVAAGFMSPLHFANLERLTGSDADMSGLFIVDDPTTGFAQPAGAGTLSVMLNGVERARVWGQRLYVGDFPAGAVAGPGLYIAGDGTAPNVMSEIFSNDLTGIAILPRKHRGTRAVPIKALAGDRAIAVAPAFYNGTALTGTGLFRHELITDADLGTATRGKWVFGLYNGATTADCLTIRADGVTASVPVDVPVGSAAAPSLYFTGDVDTGLAQLGGTDTASLVAGGVERWRQWGDMLHLGRTPTSSPAGVGMQVTAEGTRAYLGLTAYGTSHAFFDTKFARGTQAAPTKVLAGDTLFQLRNFSDNGIVARIRSIMLTDSDLPFADQRTKWSFSVLRAGAFYEPFEIAEDAVRVLNRLELPIGGAAVPSLYISGDTDTGFFQEAGAPDTLSWALGGAVKGRLTGKTAILGDHLDETVGPGFEASLDGTVAFFRGRSYGDVTTNAAIFEGYKARGTKSVPAPLLAGDLVTTFRGVGQAITAATVVGQIRLKVKDAATSGTNHSGQWDVQVANNGAIFTALTADPTAVTSYVPLNVPTGNAAAPSLYFTGDADTGFFQEAGVPDTLSWSLGGAVKGRLTSTAVVVGDYLGESVTVPGFLSVSSALNSFTGTRYSDDNSTASMFEGRKHRGTYAAPLPLQAGDVMVGLRGIGRASSPGIVHGTLKLVVKDAAAAGTNNSTGRWEITAWNGTSSPTVMTWDAAAVAPQVPLNLPTVAEPAAPAAGTQALWFDGTNVRTKGSVGAARALVQQWTVARTGLSIANVGDYVELGDLTFTNNNRTGAFDIAVRTDSPGSTLGVTAAVYRVAGRPGDFSTTAWRTFTPAQLSEGTSSAGPYVRLEAMRDAVDDTKLKLRVRKIAGTAALTAAIATVEATVVASVGVAAFAETSSTGNDTASAVAYPGGVQTHATAFTLLPTSPGGPSGTAVIARMALVAPTLTGDRVVTFPDASGTVMLNGGGAFTGAVGVPVGSIAAPSLYIVGDTDTGLAQVGGVDTLSLIAGGVERIRATAAGGEVTGTLIASSHAHVGKAPHTAAQGMSINAVGDATFGNVNAFTYADTTQGGLLRGYKARGTVAAPTKALTNDNAVTLIGNIYTGSTWSGVGTLALATLTDGDVGAGNYRGEWTLNAAGASGMTTLLRANTSQITLGAPALMVAGSAAIPGLGTVGDLDTGIAQIGGVDTLSVITGGFESARFAGKALFLGDPLTATFSAPTVSLTSTSAAFSSYRANLYADTNLPALIVDAYKARGTQAAPTALQNNDVLMVIRASGYNGASYPIVGYQRLIMTEAPGATANGKTEWQMYASDGTTNPQVFGASGNAVAAYKPFNLAATSAPAANPTAGATFWMDGTVLKFRMPDGSTYAVTATAV